MVTIASQRRRKQLTWEVVLAVNRVERPRTARPVVKQGVGVVEEEEEVVGRPPKKALELLLHEASWRGGLTTRSRLVEMALMEAVAVVAAVAVHLHP
jgi:hypothetical protein